MKRTGMMGALVLILFAAGCTFDFLAPDRIVNFDFNGTDAKVSSHGTVNTIDLKPYISGTGTCEFSVLFPGRSKGFIYVLLDAVSRSSEDATGPCSTGFEQNMIWLKLDSGLYVQEARSVLVESCQQDIHGRQGYDQSETNLSMKFVHTVMNGTGVNLRSRQYQSVLTYDNNHPEAGLSVETHELQ